MASNAFTVLGVSRDATAQEIRSAYRARARLLHPDRHVRPDGTVPQEVHEAFCELAVALRTALAARARVPVGAQIPAQRAPVQQRPVQQRPAPRRPTVPPSQRRPLREADPMVAFLTLPQRCHQDWPAEALTTWALTLGPAARRHLPAAVRHAADAGAHGPRARVAAVDHALLTLTLRGRRGPLPGLTEGRIATAYAFLEAALPRPVVVALPPRVTSLDRTGLNGAARRVRWLPVALGAGLVAALSQSGDLVSELFR
jgi:hypothetical protein